MTNLSSQCDEYKDRLKDLLSSLSADQRNSLNVHILLGSNWCHEKIVVNKEVRTKGHACCMQRNDGSVTCVLRQQDNSQKWRKDVLRRKQTSFFDAMDDLVVRIY